MQEPEITRKSWIMVASLALIWGATFLGIELALKGITPFWLAAGRIGLAAGLMAIVQAFRSRRLLDDPGTQIPWWPLLIIGALSSAVPFMLLSWGQQYVTSGFAGVSMAAVALLVLPMAHFALAGERMTARKVLGFGVGFCGVALLIGGQAFENSGSALEPAGRLACLAAAACYAVSSVMIRRLPAMDPISLAATLLYIGAAIVIPVAIIFEGAPPVPPRDALVALVILGIVPTAGANLLRVIIIRESGPTFMSLTNYQVPVWSVVLGWLVLAEPLPPSMLAGLALILAGVGLSQFYALRRLFGAA